MVYLDNKTTKQKLYIPKQDALATPSHGGEEYYAGDYIDIDDNVISVTGLPETKADKTYVISEISRVEGLIPSTDEFATRDWVNEQGFLKEHQSLANYYTKAETEDVIATVKAVIEAEIPSIEGLASEEYVDNAIAAETARTEATYLKEAELDEYAKKEDTYTKSETDTAIAEATSGAAQMSAVTEAINSAITDEITRADAAYTTEDWVNSQGFLTEHQSLDGYATTAFTEETYMKKGEVPSDVATTGYVNTQITSAIASETARTEATYLKEHQSLDGYATEDWVEDKGYITGYTETDPTVPAYVKSITQSDISNWNGKSDFSGSYNDLTDKPTIPSIEGLASEEYVDNAIAAETARTESTYLKEHQSLDDYYTSAQPESAITEAISGKQDTLTAGEGIEIENNVISVTGGTGGGETVIELTQAEYDAIVPPYPENTTYIITDALPVDLNEFASKDDLEEFSAATETALATKATASNTTARSGSYFPYWNSEGIITGGTQAYTSSQNINGSTYSFYRNTSSSLPASYAPTSVGTKDQVCLSNGSGAPVWSTYKFVFISQSAYDALATKDATTIYFIVSDD